MEIKWLQKALNSQKNIELKCAAAKARYVKKGLTLTSSLPVNDKGLIDRMTQAINKIEVQIKRLEAL